MKLAQRKQHVACVLDVEIHRSGSKPIGGFSITAQASFQHLPLFSALAPVAKATLPEVQLGFRWWKLRGWLMNF